VSLVSSFSVLMLLGCIMMVCIYYCVESCIDEICFGCGCFDYADVDSALAMRPENNFSILSEISLASAIFLLTHTTFDQ